MQKSYAIKRGEGNNKSVIGLRLHDAVDLLISGGFKWSQVNIAAALFILCGYRGGQQGVSSWASRHPSMYNSEFERYYSVKEQKEQKKEG